MRLPQILDAFYCCRDKSRAAAFPVTVRGDCWYPKLADCMRGALERVGGLSRLGTLSLRGKIEGHGGADTRSNSQ